MFTKRNIAPAVLLSAILVCACGGSTPSAPSPTPPAPSPPPAAAPQVLGQWNVTASLKAATGGDKCEHEAVQSLLGAAQPYSIVVTQTGNVVDVTVTGATADAVCTFTNAMADSSGFTTFGRNGTYSCRGGFEINGFHCSDGIQVDLFTAGQDISGNASGNQITGRWEIDWIDKARFDTDLHTTTEFTGFRQ